MTNIPYPYLILSEICWQRHFANCLKQKNVNQPQSNGHNLPQGVFIPMVGSFGLAGNLLALKLLRSKNLGIKVSFNFYTLAMFYIFLCQATFRAVLTLLSIFDSIFILSFGLAFSMPLLSDYWKVCLAFLVAT